ncbi:MAG: bifunctional enoyl-CoA hydratase/phosphate acetyltransferase [Betaproteobacteria bacterium]|nr:MAG: bifunctional enoyl-CoA hydratase/phosphate acetyltransferase [Betaproteobacteria bacterium]TAG49414.1 MAG: bifunctional enoyl-CoA hydratase/phosphate acetyltransferase [Betaproteobacteria bacterium]
MQSPSAAAHPRLDALIAKAKLLPALRTALAFPGNEASLIAALEASASGLIDFVCFGDAAQIARLQAASAHRSLRDATVSVVDTGADPNAAAMAAVAACASGQFEALMKGSLHTDELMAAVLAPVGALRGALRMTHCFVFDVPRYHKLLAITDAVVNINPDLKTKAEAISSAIALLRQLGVAVPKVAVVTAVETVNEAIPATLDAAKLVQMARAGEFGEALVEGPFGFDNAISAEAAKTKGMISEVAGEPDLIVVPDLNSGNILYKALVYMADAECAGIVLGAKVPIILTSRADSGFARVASCALASLARAGDAAATGGALKERG